MLFHRAPLFFFTHFAGFQLSLVCVCVHVDMGKFGVCVGIYDLFEARSEGGSIKNAKCNIREQSDERC